MLIDLPLTDEKKLSELAISNGFETVEDFAKELLKIAAQSGATAMMEPCTEDELQSSLAMIDASMEQFHQGQGLTIDEARRQSTARLNRRSQ